MADHRIPRRGRGLRDRMTRGPAASSKRGAVISVTGELAMTRSLLQSVEEPVAQAARGAGRPTR